jgi:hypothetical protein
MKHTVRLTNSDIEQTAEVIRDGEVVTVRVLMANGGEIAGWTYDYLAEGFEPGFAKQEAEYQVERFERIGFTRQ